jgi:hypothetical protein
MLESLFEPVKAKKDDKGVDGDWVGEHRYDIDDNLLEGVEFVDVHHIQAGLCAGTGTEEEGIGIANVTTTTSKEEN